MLSVVVREQGHFDVVAESGMRRELESYVTVLQNALEKLDILGQCNIGEAESPMHVPVEEKALPGRIGVLKS